MTDKRPFAVFDIDGTLIRWQLYHAVADELTKNEHLDSDEFEHVRQARLTWKERASEDSYQTYEEALINFYETAVAGLEVEVLRQACRRVIEKYKDQVYPYTRDLIKRLKAEGYLLFAISASQYEIIKLLADYYGFDEAGGSKYEVKAGKFTGHSQILKSEKKTEFLKKLVANHNGTWEHSIAVGDSEGDISMLSAVENPIAFNPTKALFAHAKKNKWKVVVERKNMIYQLEPKDGSYILAQADA